MTEPLRTTSEAPFERLTAVRHSLTRYCHHATESIMNEDSGSKMTADADVPDHIEALADLLDAECIDIHASCVIVTDMLRDAMERRLADRLTSETLH